MTNYKEVLNLKGLGINNSQIAAALGCSRTTVITVLKKAGEQRLTSSKSEKLSNRALGDILFPGEKGKPRYKMLDYNYIHREMAKSGMTMQLSWFEYYEACSESGEIPYQPIAVQEILPRLPDTDESNYAHQPSFRETLDVDWAGQTAGIVETDTGVIIPAYIFVATLPYSGHSYVEAFVDQKQEAWTTAHVCNAYLFFGGTTRILVPDNLKTGVDKVTKSETILNRVYQEVAQHYDTAVIPTKVKAPKDKASVEGSIGNVSNRIVAAIRNQQFLFLRELNLVIPQKLHAINH